MERVIKLIHTFGMISRACESRSQLQREIVTGVSHNLQADVVCRTFYLNVLLGANVGRTSALVPGPYQMYDALGSLLIVKAVKVLLKYVAGMVDLDCDDVCV